MSVLLIVLLLVAALLLVALGGLLAAVDAALISVSSAEIGEMAETSRSARSLRRIAEDRGSHVNAINFVRILVETGAAVIVALVLMAVFDELWIALLLSTVIMAAVSFVLVGSSPRSVGRTHPRRILVVTAPLVSGLRRILGPLARGLVVLGERVTPGAQRSGAISNEEQLLSMVDQAVELDVLEEDDREFIHSIFELGDTVAREVMVPRTDMITIRATASLASAVGEFFRTGVSRIPVVGEDEDDVVGVLHLRDVARVLLDSGAAGRDADVTTVMRAAAFVPESQKVDALLRQMQRDSVHLALVVDEYGGIAGLVTLEDVIEEVVGEISDEHDRPAGLVEQLDGRRFRVSARLAVDELGELFGVEMEDEDVDTVGGLLAKAIGRLPKPGDTATVEGVTLVAERVEGRPKQLTTVIAEADDDLRSVLDVFVERRG